ncbi:MAG: hypothetical protein ACK559_13035, partial [bacterium]
SVQHKLISSLIHRNSFFFLRNSLLLDVDGIGASIQLLIAQLVEAGEGHPQVGGLQQVLHLLAVRVELVRVHVHVRRQDPVDHLRGRDNIH